MQSHIFQDFFHLGRILDFRFVLNGILFIAFGLLEGQDKLPARFPYAQEILVRLEFIKGAIIIINKDGIMLDDRLRNNTAQFLELANNLLRVIQFCLNLNFFPHRIFDSL